MKNNLNLNDNFWLEAQEYSVHQCENEKFQIKSITEFYKRGYLVRKIIILFIESNKTKHLIFYKKLQMELF